ncbi:hypothetical protein FJZ31_26120 [Candidatus Poribacteria bacterium]|nr:hypothetical protein [Candidatus Poribacteria bacterium]
MITITSVIVIGFLYYKKKQIHGFEIEVIQDDTWFVNRDDNHRLAMVVSLKLINQTNQRIQISKCKLSGYSPKENPVPISLQPKAEGVGELRGTKQTEHLDKIIPLYFPNYDLYYAGMQYDVKPHSTQQIWVYYESRSVTMTNLIQTPLVIKDVNNKRKSVQVRIPRQAEQIKIHQEAASLW